MTENINETDFLTEIVAQVDACKMRLRDIEAGLGEVRAQFYRWKVDFNEVLILAEQFGINVHFESGDLDGLLPALPTSDDE